MDSNEINDYPPANAIKEARIADYPIIRCEDCFEILTMDLNLDKKEIQLKCEKEDKIKRIPFEKFFEDIKKYEDMNCCQFCKNKNTKQIYYLCKTCSNKILCDTCYEAHNKKDDIIKIKIDSTCKKHYNPYESYCPKCKESMCSYCSIEHDESHENDELLLKKKLLKKNKIEEFKNIIKSISSEKINIEKTVDSFIKELEEKILFIKKLKNNFLECLNMKLKFVELILNNYEKKIKDLDTNYYTINNLQNLINFNLLKLNINNNDSLDKKIEIITNCISKNLNSHFNFISKEAKVENEKTENLFGDDITKVDYKQLAEIYIYVTGLLDFNKDLLALYSKNYIYIISKKDYKKKILIQEYGINNIIECKKINDEKILIYTKKNIIFVDVLGDNDYKISDKIDFSSEIYDFNSHLDLLYINYKYDNYDSIIGSSIELVMYPKYEKPKFSIKNNNSSQYQYRLQFINDDTFFRFSPTFIESYQIKDNKCYFEKNAKIDLELNNASIIDLNTLYYCLNDNEKLLLLDKKDLFIVKTINVLNDNNLALLKINNKIVSTFYNTKKTLTYDNYDILSNGIKWNLKETKQLFEGDIINCFHSKKYILFLNVEKPYTYGYIKDEYYCTLYEIIENK